jgi:hypothetical protein
LVLVKAPLQNGRGEPRDPGTGRKNASRKRPGSWRLSMKRKSRAGPPYWDILKHVDTQTEDSLLTSLQEVDPELAQDLRENAFTIEKIYFIPDEDFAEYLRKYSERDLAVFLKGKSDQVRQKIEAMPPQRPAQTSSWKKKPSSAKCPGAR